MIFLIKLIYNLFLSIKMDRATHNDKGGIESIIIQHGVVLIEEEAGASDDKVIDALLFALVVNTHVTEHTER